MPDSFQVKTREKFQGDPFPLRAEAHLAENVYKVVMHKSISESARQIVLYITNKKCKLTDLYGN